MVNMPLPAAGVATGSASASPSVSATPPLSSEVTIDASEKRTRYFREALQEVTAIVNGPVFREQLSTLSDRPLATSADGECEITHPIEVLESLRRLPKQFTIKTRQSILHWGSIASTSGCGPIRINTGYIDQWDKGDDESKADVINNLAHELTHVIPENGYQCPTGAQRYTDGGHISCSNNKACSDAFLASYSWGDFVQCSYLVKKGRVANFKTCVMSTVNGYVMDRKTMTFKIPETSAACSSISQWR
jgi:hypothetical protein